MTAALLFLLFASDAYVGSQACARCHPKIFNSYRQTAMGRSVTLPDPALLTEPVHVEASGGRTFSIRREQNRLFQSEPETKVDHELAYAVGSGENGISFVFRRGDYLFQAPLSYYTAARAWKLSPGFAEAGEGFSRPVFEACLACHAGRVNAVAGSEGRWGEPPLSELAIGCENCHGPGGAHIASPAKSSIINPSRLPARLVEDICMGCHQAGETRILLPRRTYADLRPGRPLIETVALFARSETKGEADLLEHHTSMKASRCFIASNERLSCLTCHNPHEQPRGAAVPAHFNARCATCHTAVKHANVVSGNCIGCHMPKRQVSGISHASLTNHRIPRNPFITAVPPPPALPDPALPGLILLNGSRDTKLPLVTRLAAYGELMARSPSLEPEYHRLLSQAEHEQPVDPLVLAALGRSALAAGDVNRATTYLERAEQTGHASSLTYADLADCLTRLARDPDGLLAKAATLYPFSQPIRKRQILAFIQGKQYAQAKDALARYIADFPEDTFMRGLWNKVPH